MEEKRKICIVTGANSGIGYETALTMGISGWEIILACRSFAKGNEAVMKMNNFLRQIGVTAGSGGRAVFMEIDLSSFESIRNFAIGFRKRYSSCDLLVCNAGIMAAPYSLTSDGFETQFAVNYLGHAYLQEMMRPFLKASGSGKVIHVASRAHEKAAFNTGEFLRAARRREKDYKPWTAYAQSKLFQVMLAQRSRETRKQDGISYYAVHPGLVSTPLLTSRLHPSLRTVLRPALTLAVAAGFMRKPRKGSEGITHLGLLPALPNPDGVYWYDKMPCRPNPVVEDSAFVDEVWDETMKILTAQGLDVSEK